MSEISERLASLSPEKRALLALELKKKGKKFNSFPVSYAQQRLWLLYQLDPNSPVYNIPLAMRMNGALKIPALKKSIQELVNRHEAFRTKFATVNGVPVQIIANRGNVSLNIIDLSNLSSPFKEKELFKQISNENRKPFDLTIAPLFRANLFEISKDEYVLFIVTHHIISDGWSMGILAREFVTLYESFAQNQPSPLAALNIQYADFASWQRKRLQGEVLDKQLDYWKKQLAGNSAVLEIPTDRSRTAILTSEGGHASISLSENLTEEIRRINRHENVTMFMTLLAAFKVLLYRYSGQENISVGTTIANRNKKDIENIIGFFVNTIVLRTQLSGNPTFSEFLKRTREVSLGAFAHQDLPFEMLVEKLQPDRDLSRTPLFQVMFTYQAFTDQFTKELKGLKLSNLEFDRGMSTFDVTLVVTESQKSISILLEFNKALFNLTTIERMLKNYRTLLMSIVQSPNKSISQLPLLEENQRQQIIKEWNDTAVPFPADDCVHRLFEKQVARTPEKIAVIFEGEQITYGELNRRANQLANYLKSFGVGPEVVVGLCVDRSIDMVIGMMGILKANGAFLPLDASYPKDRLQYMIDDSGTRVLITQESLNDNLPENEAQTVILEKEWRNISAQSIENPQYSVDSQSLAYVIYTSGSTGEPKGTMLQHRGLCNLVAVPLESFKVEQDTRVLQFSSLSFDAAVWEIMITLLHNATLCLASKEVVTSGEDLLEVMRRQAISIVTLPPSVLAVLPEAPLPKLETVIIAGEKCSGDLVDRWSKDRRFFNAYGPTESTVCASTFKCTESYPEGPPIGRPIHNFQLFVLDKNLEPVPAGVPGELYIGGAGLARGYLNRPEQTADRFIPNQFDSESGARLYKTGDLAKFLPNGNLYFLGRIDQQVKIRGFRIELGEIEARLALHPAIRDVIVVAREDVPGNKRLVAYFISDEEQPLSTKECRSYLREQLPDYMVPSIYVRLDVFPLTPNGKINRKALPKPDDSESESEHGYVSPQTPTEELLAGIWSQLLWVKKIGALDNFFDLGGHSLLATQLISRIRDSFGIDIPLSAVFESSNLEALAQRIESAKSEESVPATPPFEVISRDQKLPLSFSQQRLWFLDHLEPGSPFYNIPGAFRIKGQLDIPIFAKTFNKIIDRHEILRTTIKTQDGISNQEINYRYINAIPIIDLNDISPEDRETEIERLSVEEARQPFNLAVGPLFRIKLIQLNKVEFIILLTMHHIISDGWSIQILVREVATLYQAFSEEKSSPLPELPIQYADYAHWQRQWLVGKVYDQQMKYWKEKLSGAMHVLDLPNNKPRPANQTYRGKHLSFSFPKNLSDSIRKIGQQEGGTLFMTLLAAFYTLLYHYSQQDDISIGTPIANRGRSELERLIGFFVNTLVLRTCITGDPTFREFLHRVRETCLDAYAHQDIPFEKLVDEIQPDRDLSHTPLFQVMFVLQNIPSQTIIYPELNLLPVKVETGISKFDLMLNMEDLEDGLIGTFEYNTDLYDESTIEQMIVHFQNILKEIVAHPSKKISQFTLLSEKEQFTLLADWNKTAADFQKSVCFHRQFEEQVERTPDAVAVVLESEHISYSGLNKQSNRLANLLRRKGVGPESFIGICLDRSIEMVVGILAILKAGGAYVPLDPSYPKERLSFILSDAQVSVLLSQEDLLDRLPSEQAELIFLDMNRDVLHKESEDNLEDIVLPENSAYVIFTSGSTGRPKGVVIQHRSMIHLLAALNQKIYQKIPNRKLRASLNAPISFDASVQQLVLLLDGHTLYLLPHVVRSSGEAMISFLREKRLEVLDCVPSQLKLLLATGLLEEGEWKPSVCLPGGEAIDESTWHELVKMKETDFYNMYGPTECTVDSTICHVNEYPKHPSIGTPVTNAKIYILNKHLRPVPIGVSGEIYIGGEGVGSGYLKRPDLTAECFLPNPFSQEAGDRLYKTGDLGRYLKDGHIEYIGRSDFQVKVRGFRIELGEIEAALSQHSAVKEVAVLAREDKPGDKRLVSYLVVKKGEPTPTISNLREFLTHHLPEYMIPSTFVFLDEFPLTPNGKINWKSLPAPDQSRPDLAEEFVEPRTPEEKILVNVWKEILGLKRVGIKDNFFELGGDSILSIQVIAKAKQKGLKITALQIFQYQNIEKLASVADIVEKYEAEQSVIFGEAPLTPIQHWFIEQNFSEPHHWNQSVFLKVSKKIDIKSLFVATKHLIKHHDILRLRLQQTETGWQQYYHPMDGNIPFSYIDLSQLISEEQTISIERICIEIKSSLNITNGPILQVVYFFLGEGEPGRLLITIHHLAIDGVSWRIIMDDIQVALSQLENGEKIQLPPKTTSFRRWSRKQKELAQTKEFSEILEYWLSIPLDKIKTIPTDFFSGENSEDSREMVKFALSEDETRALLKEVPPVYNTQINEVLLTALVRAFSRWIGKRTLLLNLEGHGREEIVNDIDISRTVGWFTTMFPVFLDLKNSIDPGESLKIIKEQLRRIPKGGIGYGLLRYLTEDEKIREKILLIPKPEVSFNYLGQVDQVLQEESPFEPATEDSGPDRGKKNKLVHLIDITGIVGGKRMYINLMYSRNTYHKSTIKALANNILEELKTIIQHCQSPKAGGYTTSDFPLANLDQEKLNKVLGKLNTKK